MAVCIGIVAKENYPLFIRCAPNCQDEVKYHFTVHTSLDVIEEKLASVGKPASISSSPQDLREFYLGQLYPAEDYRAYGYVTNTKIKFVIVVEASNTLIRDNEIRGIFRRLHNAFTEVVCNPFYQYGDPITSKSFEHLMSTILVEETKKENPFA